MQKLEEERNLHTEFYRKDGDILVAKTWLHDYAHDIGVDIEMDMNKEVITGAKFTFERYPEKKCVMVKDLEQSLIGMNIIHDVDQGIWERFSGKTGCENVMVQLFFSVTGIIFIDVLNKVKEGKMTLPEMGQAIQAARKDGCLVFNADVPFTAE